MPTRGLHTALHLYVLVGWAVQCFRLMVNLWQVTWGRQFRADEVPATL